MCCGPAIINASFAKVLAAKNRVEEAALYELVANEVHTK